MSKRRSSSSRAAATTKTTKTTGHLATQTRTAKSSSQVRNAARTRSVRLRVAAAKTAALHATRTRTATDFVQVQPATQTRRAWSHVTKNCAGVARAEALVIAARKDQPALAVALATSAVPAIAHLNAIGRQGTSPATTASTNAAAPAASAWFAAPQHERWCVSSYDPLSG